MPSIYIQKNSPFYWIRIYDKYERDPAKRRKSINSKIEITLADNKKIIEWIKKGADPKRKPKINGNDATKDLIQRITSGLVHRDLLEKTGIKIKKRMILSRGLEFFKKEKSIIGDPNALRPRTIKNYEMAVAKMILAAKDKYIDQYSTDDYRKLLFLFEYKCPHCKIVLSKNAHSCSKCHKKLEKGPEGVNQNSRSIYTRTLRALWNFFIEHDLTTKNIIEVIRGEHSEADPIPIEEIFKIIQYFKADREYPHHYQIIYFMLLTGCRPSSAIMQMKEDIDLKEGIIRIRNVKAGRRKKREYYLFPIHKELHRLLLEMNINKGSAGRLFPQFNPSELSYTKSLGFWVRAMRTLKIAKVISKEYTLKQIRSTFISYLINVLKMDVFTVQKLADHSDAKITDKHYIKLNLKGVREHLDEMTLDSFIPEEGNHDIDKIKLALMIKKGASNKKAIRKTIEKKLDKSK